MPQYPYVPTNVDLGLLGTLSAAGAGTTNISPANATYFTASVTAGVVVRLYVSSQSGTPTVTINLQGYDPASGQFYTIGSSGAITTSASTMYTLSAFANAAAGSSPNFGINAQTPPYYRIQVVVAGTTPSITATISAATLVP